MKKMFKILMVICMVLPLFFVVSACSKHELKEITSEMVTINSYNSEYDGGEKTPSVVVNYNGEVVESSNYTISYINNINAGNASLVVEMKKNSGYKGLVTKEFEIKRAIPRPDVYVGDSYYFTDELPEIKINNKCVAGTIKWIEGQSIIEGVYKYQWKFIPENNNYKEVTGKYELKKVDYIYKDQSFNSLFEFEDGKSYVFMNCVFKLGVLSKAKADVRFEECTFGVSNSKNIYLTSVTNLEIERCNFENQIEGLESSDVVTALELNIYNVELNKVLIKENNFNVRNVNGQDCVSIKIATRLGEGDSLVEDLDPNNSQGIISGVVQIVGNYFKEENANIYIGCLPFDELENPNETTGSFDYSITGNQTTIKLYELYKWMEMQSAIIVDKYESYNK